MQRLMNAVILSCRNATGLVEKRRHCRLGTVEGIQLKMHLSFCKNCCNYAKQTRFIDRLLHRQPNSHSSTADTSSLEELIISDMKKKVNIME